MTVNSLSEGWYTVTITDANGCTYSDDVTITEPNDFIIDSSQTNVSCYGGNDGTATAVGSGGTIAIGNDYNYLWDDAAAKTTATATNLSAGTYICTVSDDNGCSTTTTEVLQEPATLTASNTTSAYNGVGVSCNGGNDGTATAVGANGSGGYT